MDLFKIILFFLLSLCAIPAGCTFQEYTCNSKAEKMGFQSDWGWVQGCMIKLPDRWVPIESYRAVGSE